MSDVNDEIAREIAEERRRIEQEALKPKPVSRNEVQQARYVWTGGVILIDLLSAWLIFQVTTFWYYAIIWALAGAGGLLLSERYKERIGNNQEQLKIGTNGVKVSAIAIFVMAVIVGGVWVTKSYTEYLSLFIEGTVVSLFFFHLVNSYNFQHKDDGYINDNKEALLEEANRSRIRESHRAGRIVDNRKLVRGVEDEYRQQHGSAYDVARGKDTPPN